MVTSGWSAITLLVLEADEYLFNNSCWYGGKFSTSNSDAGIINPEPVAFSKILFANCHLEYGVLAATNPNISGISPLPAFCILTRSGI